MKNDCCSQVEMDSALSSNLSVFIESLISVATRLSCDAKEAKSMGLSPTKCNFVD